ncbi:MAG: FxDxF family PEP-CTERM protein [Steroidobacteraceae bacterium]
MRRVGISWGIAFVVLCGGSRVAHADFLNTTIQPNSDLSGDEVIQWDTSQSASPTLVTGTGVNDGNPAPGQPLVGVLDLSMNGSSTYTLTHNFTSGQAQAGGGTINGLGYGFVDTFVLNLPTGTASNYDISVNTCALVSSNCSGLSNLTARLYSYTATANGNNNLTIGGVTAPAAGGGVVSWTSSTGTLFDETQFSAGVGSGEYVLQIAGLATSAGGGSYTAGIGVTAVPIPAALPLLLSGIAGLGAMARRRKVSSA